MITILRLEERLNQDTGIERGTAGNEAEKWKTVEKQPIISFLTTNRV